MKCYQFQSHLSSPPLPKPHYPLPRTIALASLVKGEVLSPEKIRATNGGIAFRCTEPLHPHNHCKRTIIPLPRTNTLASLVKGEVLSPEKIRATTGGIAFLPHPFRFSDASANNPSIVGSASHCNRSSPLHKGAKGDSALPTIPKPHYPSKSTISLPPLSKVRCCRPKKFGRLPEGLLYAHQPLYPHNLLKSTSIASHHPFQLLTPQFLIIHHPIFISSLHTLDNFRR